MKKPLFVVVMLGMTLSACLPAFLQQQPAVIQQAPQADVQATAAMMGATMAAQTIAALPTPTLVIAKPSATVTQTEPPSPSATLDPNQAITGTAQTASAAAVTGTLPTPSAITAGPTSTLIFVSGVITPTETLHPRYYGTLPPQLPYGFVLVANESKAEAYISLQCTTSNGKVTIIEFPVKKSYGVDAPAGSYIYVAWVGGKKMSGSFKLDNGQDLTITLYKNRIDVGK
jgi:hypothetical protein